MQQEIPQLNKEKELSLDGIVKDPEEPVSVKRSRKTMQQSSDPSVIATVFPGGVQGMSAYDVMFSISWALAVYYTDTQPEEISLRLGSQYL